MPSSECYPIDVAPGLTRLFLDYCAAEPGARPFYSSLPRETGWQMRCPRPAHWNEVVESLADQNRLAEGNRSPAAERAIEALKAGAGAVVTGQ